MNDPLVGARSPEGDHHDSGSLDRAVEQLRAMPRNRWLDAIRSDQSYRWRRARGTAAEEYFRRVPELLEDAEEALVLICGEVQLRRELGESPDLLQYQRRFCQFAERLAIQFQVDETLEAGLNPSQDGPWEADPQLPGYELLERIGAGAAGVVYRARQGGLERQVAVKVVAIPSADVKHVARQRQEAAVLARLNHSNVVQIHEVREHRGCLYLVMEYVDGGTLASRAADTLLAPHDAAGLTVKIAEAVHAMHEAGVLHRDLKPSNVLLTAGGEPKITDFGLAKLRSGGNLLTTADAVLGTPSYMAPEQALGDANAVGPTADVYSVGAILYELLTGRAPFLGATVLDTLALIRDHEPAPPRRLQPTVPRDLETICLRCLQKAPEDRYASAAALAADLQCFIHGNSIAARRPSVLENSIRWSRRKPLVASLVALVAALVVTTLGTLAWTNRSIHSAAQAKEAALTTARDAVDRMLMRVANDTLSNLPLGHPMRQAMLEDALQFYEGFLEDPQADANVHKNMVVILNGLALLKRESGAIAEGRQLLERSIQLLEAAVPLDPQPPVVREQLAATEQALAYTWQLDPADKQGHQAEAAYRTALDSYLALEREWPQRRQPKMLCTRYFAERAFYRGDLKEAEARWRETIADGEKYLKQHPKDADARSIICWACSDLADAVLLPGDARAAEAEEVLKQGLKHASLAMASNPRSSQTREVQAFLKCRLAQCYCSTKRGSEAVPLFGEAVGELQLLCAEFPWNGGYWINLAHLREASVTALLAVGHRQAAEKALEDMLDWIGNATRRIPSEPAPQKSLEASQNSLASLLRSAGKLAEAQRLDPLHAPD